MPFRIVMLVLLLLSQPLAAFDLYCGIGMGQSTPGSSEHCAGHSGHAYGTAGNQQQTSQQTFDEPPSHQQSSGHTANGGHCQSCVSGVVLLPVATRFDSVPVPTASTILITLFVPQFQSGPLYRPPIH